MTTIELTKEQEAEVLKQHLAEKFMPQSNVIPMKGGKKNIAMKEIVPGIWKPENKGDKIKGIFISKDEGVGDFDSTIYHFDVEGIPTSVWGSAALNPKMVGIKQGNLIEIEFTGTAPSKKGADTKLFKVSSDDGKEEEVSVEKPGEPAE